MLVIFKSSFFLLEKKKQKRALIFYVYNFVIWKKIVEDDKYLIEHWKTDNNGHRIRTVNGNKIQIVFDSETKN